MINDYDQVNIGFGNKFEQTSEVILTEKMKMINLSTISKIGKTNTKIQIQPKSFMNLKEGFISRMVSKRRDKYILRQLLKPNSSSNYDDILSKCGNIETKISNDLAILGLMNQENDSDKFIQRTGGTQKEAGDYIRKYSTLNTAVQKYQQHQKKVKKFMQQNQCNRENAINFLESCDYNDDFIQ